MRIAALSSLLVLLFVVSCSEAAGGRRGSRQMGLSLHEWCYDGSGTNALMDAKCLLPGQWCVGDAGTVASLDPTGKGVCKCKPLFEETGPTPQDRCIPRSSTPFADAECDSNEDCVKLVNTECRISTVAAQVSLGKRFCQCKDDFEPDTAVATVIACKAVVCTEKPDTYCASLATATPRRPGTITNAVCITTGALTGKCGCPEGKSAVTVPTTGLTCLDVTQIPCNAVVGNPAGSCPFIGGGVGGANTAVCTSGKCGCQVKLNQGGTIKSSGTATLTCSPNTIGSICYKSSDCPDLSVTCMKTGTITPTKPGICSCGPYKIPRKNDPMRCDSTIGLCCNKASDCGVAPSTATDRPFACLRPVGDEPSGTCGCPPGSQWDAVSCKATTSPGVCLPVSLLPPIV
ncbi:hypothetical protein BV898_19461 [Hypsibius exemplaris]|uniref:EGF-like domain-containing protein n=1 Tax=Hypsibius exemplaris TaxID=2072580 RepID=A0A9X6NQP8_HYPEX|nr:hypothetical protein BV898_19461 [Hypsibius exemplaris]